MIARQENIRYDQYLVRKIPLDYIQGLTSSSYDVVAETLDISDTESLLILRAIIGVVGQANQSQPVFPVVATAKSAAFLAGLATAGQGVLIITEVSRGDFGDNPQDLVQLFGFTVGLAGLVLSLSGPAGFVIAVVGLVLAILAGLLDDRTELERTRPMLDDRMSVVDSKGINLLNLQAAEVQETIDDLEAYRDADHWKLPPLGSATHVFRLEGDAAATYLVQERDLETLGETFGVVLRVGDEVDGQFFELLDVYWENSRRVDSEGVMSLTHTPAPPVQRHPRRPSSDRASPTGLQRMCDYALFVAPFTNAKGLTQPFQTLRCAS